MLLHPWRRLHAALQTEDWGICAPLSLLCATLAATLAWGAAPALHQAAAQARADRLALRAAQDTRRLATSTQARTLEANPLAALPLSAARHARLAALLALPQRLGLRPGAVELGAPSTDAAGLTQQRIVQTLFGPYAQVRHAIGQALAADGSLALEQLRLARATPDSAEVEAQCVWVLLWHTAVKAHP